jgi:hypothetical protein
MASNLPCKPFKPNGPKKITQKDLQERLENTKKLEGGDPKKLDQQMVQCIE